MSRMPLLSKGPFHFDTLDYIICGEKTLDTSTLHYSHGPGYPLTVLFSSAVQLIARTFGLDPASTVIFSGAVLAGLAVCAFFAFVYAFSNSMSVAWFAALIFNFFPAFFSVTTFGRIDHGLEGILMSLSFFVLIRDDKRKAGKYFLSALLLGFCVTAHFSSVIAVVPWLVWYLFYWRVSQENFKPRFLAAIAAGFFLPLIALYLPRGMGSLIQAILNTMHDPRQQTKWMGLTSHVTPIVLNWLYRMITSLGICLIALGALNLWKESKKKVLLLAIWFVVPFSYLAGLAGNDPRFYIWACFAVFIFQGYAFRRLYNFRRYMSYITCVALILLVMFPRMKMLVNRSQVNYQKEFAIYLEDMIEDGSMIIVEDQALFLDYYMRSKNKILIRKPYTCQNEEMEKFLKQLEQWLLEGKNIYIIYWGFSADHCKLFYRGLMKGFKVALVGSKLNDDWNPSRGLYKDRIYKITKK
jgi:hypothetical protein